MSIIQANSENRGPRTETTFDLKKEVSQGHSMVPIERVCHKDDACQNQCSIINTSEDMSQVKVFCDRQTDRRMSFNVPRFCERRGTKKCHKNIHFRCRKYVWLNDSARSVAEQT